MHRKLSDTFDEGRSQALEMESIQAMLGELLGEVRPSSEALFQCLEHAGGGNGKRRWPRGFSSQSR